MCCNYGVIASRSDSRFSLLPSQTIPIPSISSTSCPVSCPYLSFKTHHPDRRVRVGSVKAKATIDDDFVATPPLIEAMSFYELLGIPETVTLVEIKQAYKQLARKYHPDVSPPDRVDEYTQRFIRVQEAYETLSDPRSRALYDRDMARGVINLAFSARRRYGKDEQREEKSEWKSHWQAQVSELKRRSMHKDSTENLSWGARMRRQNNES